MRFPRLRSQGAGGAPQFEVSYEQETSDALRALQRQLVALK
jgi:hypothetical protein